MSFQSRQEPASTFLLLVLFFVSGATTLVYEISWTRQLGLLFGHTVLAGSVVLASLFMGLAVGYGFGGWLSTSSRKLRLFGLLEIVAASWAVCVPWLINALHSPSLLPWISSEQVAWQSFSRAVVGIGLTLPAAIALGATLPLMSELLTRVSGCGTRAATIGYAWNTAGAMFGTLICTYWLLVNVGVSRSSYLAAGVAMVAGAVAVSLSGRMENGAKDCGSQLASDRPLLSRLRVSIVFAIAALSGFVTLALEILYTRLFSLVFHNSTYTFGNVVAVFLLSLAIGATLVAVIQRRVRPEAILFWSGIGAAACMCLSLTMFVHWTQLDYFRAGGSFLSHLVAAFALVIAVVIGPTTFCGMIFPATWKLLARDHSVGRSVGWLAMLNAIGGGMGALTASFLLLPKVGLWIGFSVQLGILGIVAVLAGLLAAPGLLRGQHFVSLVAVFAVCLGFSRLSEGWSRLGLARGEVLVKRRESAYGWIDVTRDQESDHPNYIRQNLHYRLGGSEAIRERRQAHLPLLLHPDPKQVLFLGMGTGVTAAGATEHPEVESIEIVELIPDVILAAQDLGIRNSHVLDDARVRVTSDDARHFLLGAENRYDVIVSDLFVPWESETGYLYTREHYETCAARLASDGLFCQWLPLYQLGKREFAMIADTFASIFPEPTLWWVQLDPDRPIVGLIGSPEALTVRADTLRRRMDRLRLARNRDDPQLESVEDVQMAFMGVWQLQNPDQLNHDEYPRVEFWTPESLMQGKLLKGARLAELFDTLLARLPSPSSSHDLREPLFDTESLDRSHQTQRFLLFGEP